MWLSKVVFIVVQWRLWMIKLRLKKWLEQIIKFDRDITYAYDAYNNDKFPEITAKEAKENLTLYKAKQIVEGEKYINKLFGEDFLTQQFLENKLKPYFENKGYRVEIVWDTTGFNYAYAKIIWEEEE